jgi:hypothetical protein
VCVKVPAAVLQGEAVNVDVSCRVLSWAGVSCVRALCSVQECAQEGRLLSSMTVHNAELACVLK